MDLTATIERATRSGARQGTGEVVALLGLVIGYFASPNSAPAVANVGYHIAVLAVFTIACLGLALVGHRRTEG